MFIGPPTCEECDVAKPEERPALRGRRFVAPPAKFWSHDCGAGILPAHSETVQRVSLPHIPVRNIK